MISPISRHIIPVLLIALVIGCSRPEVLPYDHGTIIFYKQSTAGSYTVYINNIPYGNVPYVDRTPACNTSEGLRLRMEPGTHYVDVRNNNNPVWTQPVQVTLARGECRLYRVPQ